tara:strand:+ start:1350 stop:1670 length:321 start_codon:yes stop_codon:yes gene_type:complete
MNVKDKIDDILKSLKLELPSSLNIDFYKIFYLLLFLIIYISNQHSVEKQIREINKLEKEVEELRTDYVTLNNNYMFSRKESEILKRVKEIGLKNSKLPPEKISYKE